MAVAIRPVLNRTGEFVGSAQISERYEIFVFENIYLLHWKVDDVWNGGDLLSKHIRSLTPEEIEGAKARLADCKFGAEEIIVDLKD